MKQETFITFEEREGSATGKTRRWAVHAKQGRLLLGAIGWFGRWRCYAFAPVADSVFEHRCLRDVADFCEGRTREQRAEAAGKRHALRASSGGKK